MEIIAYTIAGVLLYLFSDWILNRIEIHLGKRFEHRSVVFFFILAPLALVSFALIRFLIN